MAPEVQNEREPSVAALVGGIVHDVQDLVRQEMRLLRQEIEADLRKTKEAVSILAVGGALCLVSVFSISLTVAHLIHWMGAPASLDPAALPLWACYAIAGILFLIGGGMAVMAGTKKITAIGAAPLKESVKAMKENIEWKTKPSAS
jgi:hypothetical protein